MLDPKQLQIFTSVARHLSMARAGEELEITPSAVSHSIRALETDLGVQLIDRTTRHLAITPAGQLFLTDAVAILDRMVSSRARLYTMQTVPAGTLRLGGSATACLHLIPSILREFRESFPEHTIQITQVNTMDAALMLQERRIDLAVIPEPADHHGGQFIVAAEDRLAFLLNPLHPWAIRNKVDRATIPREHFILPSRRIETHARIEAYFRAERIKIRPFIEIDSEGAILKLVQLDLGIGILPNWLARDELERGILKSLPLGRRKLTRRWGILARKRRLDFAENLFVGICKHVVSRMLK